MTGRRTLVAAAIAALMAGGCGASAPSGLPATATQPAAATSSDAAAAPASGDTPAGGAPPELLGAVGSADASAATLAERDARAWLDTRTGLTATIGSALQAWLQETRSAHVTASLEDNGIDITSLETAAVSTAEVASLDLPLTAAGFGWVGTGIGSMGLIQSGVSLVGSGQTPSTLQPRHYSDTRTEGDTRLTTTTDVRMTLVVSGSRVIGDVDITEDTSATSVSTGAATGSSESRSHIHVEADVCPDASGGITVTITSDLSSTGGAAGGGYDLSSTITGAATVNDAAFLASEDRTIDTSMTGTDAAGATRSGQATSTISSTYGSSGRGSTTTGSTFTVSGDYTPGEAGALQGVSSLFAFMLMSQALEKAQDAWRSGTCVEIRATESSRTVVPNATVPFTAQPRHRIEGVDLAKPVVATFAGERSVAPVGTPIPAPADFTFTAGALDGRRGTVTMTSTSNRGIGTLDVTFTVKVDGWTIDAAFTNAVGARGTLQGTKCGSSLAGAWKVVGTYSFMGFDGRQVWRIDLNALASLSPAGDPVYNGTYTYADRSTGPYGVKQKTDTSGRVEATVDEDFTVTMTLTETSREQTATAPQRGTGTGPQTPQTTERPLVWTLGATC